MSQIKLNTVLASLSQAENDTELNKAMDAVLSKMLVKADDDGMNKGLMSNREVDTDVVPSSKVRSLLIEIYSMHKDYNALSKAYNNLQAFVDRGNSSLMDAVTAWIYSKSDALKANEVYTSEWFSQLPYSMEMKTQIAQNLIKVCEQFNVTNDFWANLVNYQSAAVDFSTYAPQKG